MQLCHVHLLKPYFSSSSQGMEVGIALGPETPDISQTATEDSVCGPNDALLNEQLDNSEKLSDWVFWSFGWRTMGTTEKINS